MITELSDEEASRPCGGQALSRVVDSLSDDERPSTSKPYEEPPASSRGRSPCKRKRDLKPARTKHEVRTQVVRCTQSVCKCARKSTSRSRRSCFQQFGQLVDKVLDLRLKIYNLHKLDSDKFVPWLMFANGCAGFSNAFNPLRVAQNRRRPLLFVCVPTNS